jgi:4-hydroxybenzoate polyprenyltransferase
MLKPQEKQVNNMLKNKIAAYLKLMRFHQPIGIWLLLSPAMWALWIAGQGNPQLKNIAIIFLGSVVMRAAGCVINDIADRNFDKHVERTKNRPLTSGQITLFEAQFIFVVLITLAAVLLLFLNSLCYYLSIAALLLACLYPFTKRWISYPQFFLSLAFGMGIPIAYAAELNQLTWMTGLLYITNIIWTLIYDTEYAMTDRKDDLKINIHSTAILWGKHELKVIYLLQLLMVTLLMLVGGILKLNEIYFLSVFCIIILFIYQQKLISTRQPQNCLKAFKNNQWVGVFIFVGIALSFYHLMDLL